jgi:hypothetical protein
MLLPTSITLMRTVRDGDVKEADSWTGHKEDLVVIRKGELLLGRLCKATMGSGPSLVHILWKDVGPWAAAKFVSDAQRIGNACSYHRSTGSEEFTIVHRSILSRKAEVLHV